MCRPPENDASRPTGVEAEADAVSYVRRHPEMFLHSGEFIPDELAGQLVTEALLAGCRQVQVNMHGKWYVVHGSTDWLSEVERDPFTEIVPMPKAGVNSMYAEILLTAFAGNLVTASSESELRIIAGVAGNDLLEVLRGIEGRVVAFTS